MSVYIIVFALFSLETVCSRQADIDINRIKLVPKTNINHQRRSADLGYRGNDYDDHSSELYMHQEPLPTHIKQASTNQETPLKVYQPREDPRLFYLSDAYLKENNRKHLKPEVSEIYPLVYPGEDVPEMSMPMKISDGRRRKNGGQNCIKCPHDRTLIAKPGSDRVFLQRPRLTTCSGRRAPRTVHFDHMYGPMFGSLIEKGSHMVIGRIRNNNQLHQTCKIQIHVVTQSCPIPKYLNPHCDESSRRCNFTCRDRSMELRGSRELTCEGLKWNEDLPVCRAHTWCPTPIPPEHGRLSCKGNTKSNGMEEGSRCKLRCENGWYWNPRTVTVCRRGGWTRTLNCQRNKKRV